MRTLIVWALAGTAPAWAAPFSPSSYLDFTLTPAQIEAGCKAGIAHAKGQLDALAQGVKDAPRTFDDTPGRLDRAGWELADSAASFTFAKYVSVSSSARAAGNDCETAIGQFAVEAGSREDLFKAVKEYAALQEYLPGDQRRLLDKQLLDFKRAGLLLPPAQRAEVTALRKRLVELDAAFGKNLNEVKDFLLVTRAELEGMPDDYIARLGRDGDRYKVTVEYPDYFPFMDNAKDADARRRLNQLFFNRAAKDNPAILREVLDLRRQSAKLLGYRSHAEYVLEERMAKDPKDVRRFLSRLEKKLKVLAREELKVLAALKAREEGAKSDGVLNSWDWRYYDNLLRREKHQIDKEKVKEYFPMETVTEGMLSVYQTLLGLKFRRIPDAAVWHPDVTLYEIKDAAGGEPIAYFYMDLFPREGKYKHAAAFDLVKGRLLPDGTYQKPVSAIVANFNKPSPGKPSLLKHGEHEEVETYFHEFGHIMHQTLTKAPIGRFSGSSVARDFVEAPSQMLENWVWDPAVLESLSGHYQDPSRKLPKDLLERMIAAKNVNSGLVNLRQIFFATYDMTLHTAKKTPDTTAEWVRLSKEIALIPAPPETKPEASFGHLMGYDAGYYGYMWSKVYAEDMFSRFEEAGVLDQALGRRYREQILEPGSSRDEAKLLRGFLEREPNEDAFLKSLGLDPKRS